MPNTDAWYTNIIYNRYWKHYQYAMGWMRRHRIAYWQAKAKSDEYENRTLMKYIQYLHATNSTSNDRLSPGLRNGKIKKSHYVQQTHEEIEFEITEEMLAFLEKSEQHKKELRVKREAEERQEKLDREYIDGCVAPKEQKGAQRTAEMKILYGKNAAKIHGMETAMQLTFNRNCDFYQPKHWPNIPLNL